MTDERESARLLMPSERIATDGMTIPMEIFIDARIILEIMLKTAVCKMMLRRISSEFSGCFGDLFN